MLEKNFCLKKRWHMGQVWKDEKNHQVEMGRGEEFYQKKQHEAMRVQRGPVPRTGVLLGCEGCK